MELNAEMWPELFLKFGPYAVLALFVLWVIPHTSKRLSGVTNNAPKSVQVCTTIAVGISWAVVLLTVGYIVLKWSPVRVYHGQLGVLNESEKIVPVSDRLYVRARGIMETRQERWEFVLVDREDDVDRAETADFVYFWGEGDDDYNVYSIPVGTIVDRQVKKFSFVPGQPTEFYTWRDDDWQLASSTAAGGQRREHAFDLGWNAHADDADDLERLSQMLDSPNRLVKVEARMELRKLSDEELEMLERTVDDQDSRELIQREQERRWR